MFPASLEPLGFPSMHDIEALLLDSEDSGAYIDRLLASVNALDVVGDTGGAHGQEASMSDSDDSNSSDDEDSESRVGGSDDDSNSAKSKRTTKTSRLRKPTVYAPNSLKKRRVCRLRHELERLRGIVAGLESQVELLQGSDGKIRRKRDGSVGSSPKTEGAAEPTMWQTIAARQYQQRRESEGENCRLRAYIAEQIKVTESVQRFLRRSSITPKVGRPVVSSTQQPWHPMASSITSCTDLLRSVQDLYAATDSAVLSEPCFASMASEVSDVRIHKSAPRDATWANPPITAVDGRNVPFLAHDAAEVVWKYLTTEVVEAHSFLHVAEFHTEHAVGKRFQMTVETPRRAGHFSGNVAAQRYTEPNSRVVIAWASEVTPLDEDDTIMPGFSLRLQGWFVVRPVQDPTAQCVSQVLSKFVVLTVKRASSTERRRRIDTLSTLVQQGNVLLQEALRRRIDNALLGAKSAIV